MDGEPTDHARPLCRQPVEEVHAVVAAGFATVLDLPTPPAATDSFFDLGGDSFGAVRLAVLLSNDLGVEVPATLLLEEPSIARLSAALTGTVPPEAHAPAGDTSRGIVTLRVDGSRIPWVLIGARTNPDALRRLAQAFGPNQPVDLLPSIAQRTDGRLHTSFEAAVTDAVARIRTLRPAGPLALFGSCSDGAAAYAVGRQLQAQDVEVALVAITDAPVPRSEAWTRRRSHRWLGRLMTPSGTLHRRRHPLAEAALTLARLLRRPRLARLILGNQRHLGRALRLQDRGGQVPTGREQAYARYAYARLFRSFTPRSAPGLPLLLVTSVDHGLELAAAWSPLVGSVTTGRVDCSHADLAGLREPVLPPLASALQTAIDTAASAARAAGTAAGAAGTADPTTSTP